jgi:uncharacterized protein GlcG (DUF336 family)
MPDLTLAVAQTILETALRTAREKKLKPVAVVVYDDRGSLKALAAQDGTSLRRAEVAMGKAHGALALGVGSRGVGAMALERPHFVAAVTHAVGGSLVPAPGGVLIRGPGREILGAVGISGDTSDNDEVCAIAGIEAAGLTPDAG